MNIRDKHPGPAEDEDPDSAENFTNNGRGSEEANAVAQVLVRRSFSGRGQATLVILTGMTTDTLVFQQPFSPSSSGALTLSGQAVRRASRL